MAAGLVPPRILLAEDNLLNRKVTLGMLAILGFEADVAVDGIEAVAACRRRRYDLILMDCQMPRLDGFEATRQIRQMEKESGTHTLIIALTAHTDGELEETCREAGMDDFFPKPFEKERVRILLHKWFEKPASYPSGASFGKTPEPAPADTLIDKSAIEAIASLQTPRNPRILEQIIRYFIGESPGWVQTLADGAAQADPDLLWKTAHQFKSGAAQLGAGRLADLCMELERMGKAGALDGADDLIDEMKALLPHIHRALRRYVDAEVDGSGTTGKTHSPDYR